MKAVVVVDLGYGDSGKGVTVDSMVRKYKAPWVIRYNSGPQAAHNVIRSGVHWTASQLGAGQLSGARTYLTRFVSVSIPALLKECDVFQASLSKASESVISEAGWFQGNRVFVDPECPVITAYHGAANRLSEIARGSSAHGSCGVGFGRSHQEFWEGLPPIMMGSFQDPEYVRYALEVSRTRLVEEFGPVLSKTSREVFSDLMESYARIRDYPVVVGTPDIGFKETVVFEGAQGVGLDEWFGFHPHTTRTNTTTDNAFSILSAAGVDRADTHVIGCVRTYTSRHGAGPLLTEGPSYVRTEIHNATGRFQGAFRFGAFDSVLFRSGIAACSSGVDSLSVSHMDQIHDVWDHCVAYDTPEGVMATLPVNTNRVVNGFQPHRLDFVRASKPIMESGFVSGISGRWSVLHTIEESLGKKATLVGFGPESEKHYFL